MTAPMMSPPLWTTTRCVTATLVPSQMGRSSPPLALHPQQADMSLFRCRAIMRDSIFVKSRFMLKVYNKYTVKPPIELGINIVITVEMQLCH